MSLLSEAETAIGAAAGPGWLKLLLPIGAVLALLAAVWAVYHGGERAGSSKVTVKAQAQHAQAVTDARTDERDAAASSAAIGTATGTRNTAATAAQASAQETIHHAIDILPAAPVGAAPPRVDERVLTASLDALVDRANRAAAAPAGQP